MLDKPPFEEEMGGDYVQNEMTYKKFKFYTDTLV
jgi:hypothetical protein